MKRLISLLLLTPFLISCGGGGSNGISIEPTVAADTTTNGAYNAFVDLTPVESELQTMIDDLGGAGEIKLGCGTYQGGIISLHNGVSLVGSGICTKIPSVRAQGDIRTYFISVSNLTIDGSIDGQGVIGIDFTNCSECRAENIRIKNVDYGVLLTGSAYGNHFENLTIRADLECYEIVDGANENTIENGSCLSPDQTRNGIGVWLRNVNNIRISNVWFENLDTGFKLDTGARHTTILAPRCERMRVCVEMLSGSKETYIINSYKSSAKDLIAASDATYKVSGY